MPASLAMNVELTLRARSANDAKASVGTLNNAVAELEDALGVGHVGRIQDAVKLALEAIHELEDARKRGEWSQAGWDADAVGLWRGLNGARNASHHSASHIVVFQTVSDRDDCALWDIEPAAIADLRSERQQIEYNARLAGKATLPQLRDVAAAVTAAVAPETE